MFDEETQRMFLQEFMSENSTSLDQIERYLLKLEGNPTNKELLNAVFRYMHTIKGNCRMMGFGGLEELTHCAESVLQLISAAEMSMTREIGSVLLAVVDSVRKVLRVIETTGKEGDFDFSAQIDKLQRLQNSPQQVILDLTRPDDTDDDRTGTDALSVNIDTIHLPIKRLDGLMNIVGEMVVTFNQLRYSIVHNQEINLEEMEHHLQSLQDEVIKYRLQPIGRLWDTYHRLVRDLAVESGKKVYLNMTGEETEVDRVVLLSIKDILGHLIRNAVDHGIEPPDVRPAKGKPALGKIGLCAQQRHGQIYIDVSDDGAGIDVTRVRAKAVELGLVTPQQVEVLSDAEVFRFIMEPGFSTARKVSKISGRGVGMDVVKREVEKVGGTISIFSEIDKGTRFCIRIPQTMAIVPVLLVRSPEQRFAISQADVMELMSFYDDEIEKNVQRKMHHLMVVVRQGLVPLLRLEQVISGDNMEGAAGGYTEAFWLRRQCHVVLLHCEDGDFGLEVEEIEEPVSLVIKPLTRMFSHIKIISGSAIMPDGSVSFLLNVSEIGKLQHG
uniref:Chemotaxis protein CheA n=1 Tax=uncultured Nitrospirota bacterium TaxID=170969 RepID=A0A142BU39_9BACT|nr:chemotaxis protein CheA [uncultured Nitrospirota bacterium]